jgi:hypothetical protein
MLGILLALVLASALLPGCGSKKATSEPSPTAPVTAPPAATTPAPVKEPPPAPKLPGAVAVMIDNHVDAVPQSGLDKADIVYEMEAEGGITRFMALFYRESAEKVGPVRSARMGFYDIAYAYGLPYVHVGGNYDVLLELKNRNRRLLNVDDMTGTGGSFWRTTDRKAPHNDYTSTTRIVNWANEVKFGFKPLAFFPEGPAPAGGKPVTAVAFTWGPKSQDVIWTWNGMRFERSQSGVPHVTDTGARIQADNLVVLFTKFVWDQKVQDGEGEYHVSIVGSGSGYFYRDGKVIPIQWKKTAKEEPYTFTTAAGESVPFGPGQTWVEVLKSPEHVTQGAPQ